MQDDYDCDSVHLVQLCNDINDIQPMTEIKNCDRFIKKHGT